MRPLSGGYRWPTTPQEAIALQNQLAGRLILEGDLGDIDLIAGADCSNTPGSNTMIGAVAVWSMSRREVVASATAVGEATFPYIPGLLAFRELPVLLEAFGIVGAHGYAPLHIDAVISDGHGIAHPRGFGIACHLGLLLGIPTVGCGKSRLVGEFVMPATQKGSSSLLLYKEREVGQVVCTRDGVAPVFVSPGHLIGMKAAVDLILRCCVRYRLPEPIRTAHKLAGDALHSHC